MDNIWLLSQKALHVKLKHWTYFLGLIQQAPTVKHFLYAQMENTHIINMWNNLTVVGINHYWWGGGDLNPINFKFLEYKWKKGSL